MRTLVIAATMLAWACGGGSVALDDYATSVRVAYCSHLVSCGEMESIETCVAANTGFDFQINGLDLRLSASRAAAIDMAKLSFDGDNAKRCLDELGKRGCDPTTEASRVVPDACLHIFDGTLHGDEACAFGDECISRQCDVPACEDSCCPGACVGDSPPARAQLDESCEVASCDNGLFCDDGTATCVALKSQGGFCVSIAECRFGLYCNQAGECTGNLPTLGEPCTGPCRDEGTQCSTASRTCVPVSLVGQTCQMSSDCSPFYTCDVATGRCIAGVALGADCNISSRCAGDGAFCDIPPGDVMGTCALARANGEPCDGNPGCQSQTCDATTGQCVAEPVCL